jgi:hypothetical protein
MTDLEDGRSEAAGIPARAGLDRTAGLLLEGYPFLADCRRLAAGDPATGHRCAGCRPDPAAGSASPTSALPDPPPTCVRRPDGAADCEPATRATQPPRRLVTGPQPMGGPHGSRSGSARYLWLDRGRDRAAGALRQVLLGPTLADVRHRAKPPNPMPCAGLHGRWMSLPWRVLLGDPATSCVEGGVDGDIRGRCGAAGPMA